MRNEVLLRQKMKLAYQLGVEAYKKGIKTPYLDEKMPKLMVGISSLDTKYITEEWNNGYSEERKSRR